MKQFRTIFNFELSNYFRNKVFVGSTIVIVLLIAVVMLIPDIKGIFTKTDKSDDEKKPVMLIATDMQDVENAFSETFKGYDVKVTDKDSKWIKRQIANEKAECAFEINDMASYTYYVNDISMYDTNKEIADEIMGNMYKVQAMTAGGMKSSEITQVMSYRPESHIEKLGKDQMQNFFYTYIMIFALYMVILLYGQMVATSVASEKSSRAMEVLITSAKPVNMMFGKVIASCLAGLIQMIAIFGSSLLLFRFMGDGWEDNPIVTSIFDISPMLLLYMVIFFILGFLIYGFLYGAVSSLASKVEEINTLVMPITMIFIIAFLVVVFSMSSGNIDNIAMQICSYIPFTSPIAMFVRIAMGSVPTYQILLSIGILIVSMFGTGVIAAKIYKVGVLLYGTTPKFSSVIKALKNSN